MMKKKGSRVVAALALAGVLFSIQGMTAFAGTVGVGAAKSEMTGPGMTNSQSAGSVTEVQVGERAEEQVAGGQEQSQAQDGREQAQSRLRHSPRNHPAPNRPRRFSTAPFYSARAGAV